MTDRIIFTLTDGWALGHDDNQWIVLKRRNIGTQSGWKPVAFVATKKRILRRVLLEKGITPTPEAMAELDALLEQFRDWRRMGQREAQNGTS
jgi:hypothetical protein